MKNLKPLATPSLQWAAQLDHVREVSLLGTADLAYWKARLKDAGLVPIERDGRAQILISGADSKYLGIKFQELSFSILAAPTEEQGREGAYLLRAFNSQRFFAFCERVFFSTPYYHGMVHVMPSYPAAIELVLGGDVVFRAAMATASREPAPLQDDGWEGPVFLPGNGHADRAFYARVHGMTGAFLFLQGKDELTIKPGPGTEALRALVDSHLHVAQWNIRTDAMHAKSKTYARTKLLARLAIAKTT